MACQACEASIHVRVYTLAGQGCEAWWHFRLLKQAAMAVSQVGRIEVGGKAIYVACAPELVGESFES